MYFIGASCRSHGQGLRRLEHRSRGIRSRRPTWGPRLRGKADERSPQPSLQGAALRPAWRDPVAERAKCKGLTGSARRLALRLRASNQPSGQRTGGRAVSMDHRATDDGRGISVCALHQTTPAAWQIVYDLGRVKPQPVEIDDVQVGLVARSDQAAIQQADRFRRAPAQRVNDPRQRQTCTACAVSRPMREHEGRRAAVADRPAVRATIAEPEHGAGVLHHRQARIERAVNVVGDRVVQGVAAVAFEHQVIGQRLGARAEAARPGCDARLRRGLVVRRIAEQEHAVEVAHHRAEHG